MLGLGFGLNRGRRIGGFVGLLDLFPNAAAAYSLRKLRAAYSGSAVRVRRSSDNTEQDIGFDANGDLDTTALTTFVNADVNLFTSDYSSGGVAEPTRNNFTVTIDETKDGKTECLKAVWNGTSPAQLFKNNFLPTEQGVTFDISAEFYIEGFTGVRMGANSNFGDLNLTTNEWATYTQTITVNGISDDFVVFPQGGTNGSTIWLKNIVITQTTADGHVTTWYDQSLSNNATQTTAANQPKIVSAGSLVTENGKAAINFDGVDDYLTLPASIGSPFTGQGKAISAFNVTSVVSGNRTLWSITGVSFNDYYFSSHDGINFRFFARGGVGALKSSTSLNTFGAGQYLKSDILPEEVAGVQNGDMYIDGNQEVTSFDYATGTKTLDRGGGIGALVRSSISNYFNGNHQEIIFFDSDQSANRTAIETNINNFYSIYP